MMLSNSEQELPFGAEDAPEPGPGTELVPRATIEEIVGHRNRALALFAEAHTAIARADAAVKAAQESVTLACFGKSGVNNYSYEHEGEINSFYKSVRLMPRPDYLTVARKLTDLQVWGALVEHTDLERLMDNQAKDQLRDQMKYVPERTRERNQLITGEEVAKGLPEVTVENVYATLQGFLASADMIFARGVANAFSKLDRRFRSHDGFKIGQTRAGNRIVMTYAISEYGSLNYGATTDTIIDVERAFAVLDGNRGSNFLSLVMAIDHALRGCHSRQPFRTSTDYFEARGFKNGNLHIWFERPDLLAKVNKVLADYYGEVIGDGMNEGRNEKDPFAEYEKRLPAKYFGFYPTPPAVAERVMDAVPLYREENDPPLRILEPSAGTGNLARLCAQERTGHDHKGWGDNRTDRRWTYRHLVDCIEIQPCYADQLRAEGIYNRVWCQDFLQTSPKETGLYDVVVMNPPFDLERDLDHVQHALKFLKADGLLVAIVSAGIEFRSTMKAKAFRALMERMKGQWIDLPAGSFAEQGTNVNTMLLRVRKDGANQGWIDGRWSLVKAESDTAA